MPSQSEEDARMIAELREISDREGNEIIKAIAIIILFFLIWWLLVTISFGGGFV